MTTTPRSRYVLIKLIAVLIVLCAVQVHSQYAAQHFGKVWPYEADHFKAVHCWASKAEPAHIHVGGVSIDAHTVHLGPVVSKGSRALRAVGYDGYDWRLYTLILNSDTDVWTIDLIDSDGHLASSEDISNIAIELNTQFTFLLKHPEYAMYRALCINAILYDNPEGGSFEFKTPVFCSRKIEHTNIHIGNVLIDTTKTMRMNWDQDTIEATDINGVPISIVYNDMAPIGGFWVVGPQIRVVSEGKQLVAIQELDHRDQDVRSIWKLFQSYFRYEDNRGNTRIVDSENHLRFRAHCLNLALKQMTYS